MEFTDKRFFKAFKMLQETIHNNSKNHGFWPKGKRNVPEALMLIVSELSEALEDYRDNKLTTYVSNYINGNDKPCGFPTELADAVVRILDLAEGMKIDLLPVIVRKMLYNESRPYKHGRKL